MNKELYSVKCGIWVNRDLKRLIGAIVLAALVTEGSDLE
jgi:hypothetical protein